MKQTFACLFMLAFIVGCNTKQGADYKVNPAEFSADSTGTSKDLTNSASTDSNKTGDPAMPSGTSDLQAEGDDGTDQAISSDGNYIEGEKQKENKDKIQE